VALATNGTLALIADASQNVGIGVTPSAWGGGGYKAIEFAGGNAVWTTGAQLSTVSNAYYDGTQWRAKTTGPAAIAATSGGSITFYASPSVSAGSVVTFTQTLQTSYNATLGLQGSTVTGGTGIAFPATQSASSNANTLDDYEEGTFTPTLTNFTVGNGNVQGSYTKVGDLVTVQITAQWGSTTSSGIVASVTGLPFPSQSPSSTPYCTGIGVALRQGVGWYTLSVTMNSGGATQLNQVNLTGGGSVLSGTNPVTFAVSDYFSFTMTYKTNT
jgi:hypothetical protein